MLPRVGGAAAGCYYASLKIWPWTYCRRCQGDERNTGFNRKRFGLCGGRGRTLRFGARMPQRNGGGRGRD